MDFPPRLVADLDAEPFERARWASTQLMKRPRGTHKRTESERYAALASSCGAVRSGINPALFSVMGCATPQI